MGLDINISNVKTVCTWLFFNINISCLRIPQRNSRRCSQVGSMSDHPINHRGSPITHHWHSRRWLDPALLLLNQSSVFIFPAVLRHVFSSWRTIEAAGLRHQHPLCRLRSPPHLGTPTKDKGVPQGAGWGSWKFCSVYPQFTGSVDCLSYEMRVNQMYVWIENKISLHDVEDYKNLHIM